MPNSDHADLPGPALAPRDLAGQEQQAEPDQHRHQVAGDAEPHRPDRVAERLQRASGTNGIRVSSIRSRRRAPARAPSSRSVPLAGAGARTAVDVPGRHGRRRRGAGIATARPAARRRPRRRRLAAAVVRPSRPRPPPAAATGPSGPVTRPRAASSGTGSPRGCCSRPGQQHHQPVDADAETAGARHAVLEGAHVVVVDVAGLGVALRPWPAPRPRTRPAARPASFCSL